MKKKRLETENLILRQLTVEDAPAVFLWGSDEKVNRYMIYPLYRTVEDGIEWLKTLNPESPEAFEYGIVQKESGELIGSSGLYYHKDKEVWSFGYNLRSDMWNRGYATEATRAIIDYAGSVCKIKILEAEHAVDNPASGRVMEKLGLHFDHYSEYTKLDHSATFQSKVYRLIYPEEDGSI